MGVGGNCVSGLGTGSGLVDHFCESECEASPTLDQLTAQTDLSHLNPEARPMGVYVSKPTWP